MSRSNPRSTRIGRTRRPLLLLIASIVAPDAVLAEPNWNALGTQRQIGTGRTPSVDVDAQGNIHVVFMGGGGIHYRKANPQEVFGTTETIPAPEGAGDYNSPHVVCDANDVPHVVFEKDYYGASKKAWYTNRIGGTWKMPVVALYPQPAPDHRINYPRLAILGQYAFVGGFAANVITGPMARLSNLSTIPTVDNTIDTILWVPTPMPGPNNHIFVVGRNGPSGHYVKEYNLALSEVAPAYRISNGTQEKTSESTAGVMDAFGRIHAAGTAGKSNSDDTQFWYNNSERVAQGNGSVLGLDGVPGSGWFGEEVFPHMAVDIAARAYLGYRDFSTGEGKVAVVVGNEFSTPAVFTPAISSNSRWNTQLAPTPTGGIYAVWDVNGISYLRSVGKGSFDLADGEIFADLGTSDLDNGVMHPRVSDGDTVSTSIGGRECRRNDTTSDQFFYFSASDAFAYKGSRPDVLITIGYYDTGSGTLVLQYDSNTGTTIPAIYKTGGSVTLTNTNTWLEHTFQLDDAYFGNRQNAGADFRIQKTGGGFCYLDTVKLSSEPTPPVLADVAPDPAGALVDEEYIVQIPLLAGYPAPQWTFVQPPPPGAVIDGAGKITGWTPGFGDLAQHIFEVKATNSQGEDTESWTVIVVSRFDLDRDGDVDLGDFGRLQACQAGSGFPYGSTCDTCDFDHDGDVDRVDVDTFTACMNGSGATPGC